MRTAAGARSLGARAVLGTIALTGAFGGCEVTIGGDEDATTVTEPATTETERTMPGPSGTDPAEPPEPPPPPTGPTGVLGTEGVGEATVGMTQADVEDQFGTPDRTETVNFGAGAAPQIDWVWTFDDGDLRLQFETEGDTLTGYRCETAQLATSSGLTVGDSFDPIAERYGDQLEEAPIGEGLYLLSEGEPGTYPALTFEVTNAGVVRSIGGGVPQAAGE